METLPPDVRRLVVFAVVVGLAVALVGLGCLAVWGWGKYQRLVFYERWSKPCPVCANTTYEPATSGLYKRCTTCYSWIVVADHTLNELGPLYLVQHYLTDDQLLAGLHIDQDTDAKFQNDLDELLI